MAGVVGLLGALLLGSRLWSGGLTDGVADPAMPEVIESSGRRGLPEGVGDGGQRGKGAVVEPLRGLKASEPTAVLELPTAPDSAGPTQARNLPDFGPRFVYDEERTLRGRVVFPEGTPEDEEAFLVLECATPVQRAPGESEASHFVNEMFISSFHQVSRTPLGASGEFDLDVPSNTSRVRLDVDARYLHLSRKADLFQSRLDQPVVLEPWLGGWVTVQLVPPEETGHDPDLLVGREVALSMARTTTEHRATAVVDSKLRAVFRGLPATRRTQNPLESESDYLSQTILMPRYSFGGSTPFAPFLARRWFTLQIEPGSRREIELLLEDSRDLAGRVVDPEGHAIEGAQVSARFKTGGGLTRSARTEADGTFELRTVPHSLMGIEASRDGYLSTGFEGAELEANPEPSPWDFVLDPGLAISGVLRLESGEPVVGYGITVYPSSDRWLHHRKTPPTDEAGRFRITGLTDEPHDLRVRGFRRPNGGVAQARNDGAESPIHARADLKGVDAGTENLELVLRFPERGRKR